MADTVETLTKKVRKAITRDAQQKPDVSTSKTTFNLIQALDCIETHCIPKNDIELQEELLEWTGRGAQ